MSEQPQFAENNSLNTDKEKAKANKLLELRYLNDDEAQFLIENGHATTEYLDEKTVHDGFHFTSTGHVIQCGRCKNGRDCEFGRPYSLTNREIDYINENPEILRNNEMHDFFQYRAGFMTEQHHLNREDAQKHKEKFIDKAYVENEKIKSGN